MDNKIQFKQSIDFNRQTSTFFVIPNAEYHLGKRVPPTVNEILNPVQGEIYYFDDPTEDRPAILVYTGERGNVITALEVDGRGSDGSTTNGSFTLNTTITSNLKSAFQSRQSLGINSYLHIYSRLNAGVYLIDSINDVDGTITVHSSSTPFVSENNISWSVRDTESYKWMDLAKPEDYLNLNEYQPLLSSSNRLPFNNIDFLLTATQLSNLANDKLANGGEPWLQTSIDVANLQAIQSQILARVELNDLNTPTNSIFSGGNITLQTALEQLDAVVLADARDNYITEIETDFGIQVGQSEYLNDVFLNIRPTIQIGGSQDSGVGIRSGLLCMNSYDSTGAYAFIRSDREPNTFGSKMEPEYSWYPYVTTGIFLEDPNTISTSISGKRLFSTKFDSTNTLFSIFYHNATLNNEKFSTGILTNDNLNQILFNLENTTKITFTTPDLVTQQIDLFTIEFTFGTTYYMSKLQFAPWFEFSNPSKLTQGSLIRFTNLGGVPSMFFFDTLGDQYGGIQASVNVSGAMNLIASKELYFIANNEFRARLDTFESVAFESKNVAINGATFYANNTVITYQGVDYRDYLVVDSNEISNFSVGDFVIIEHQIYGGTGTKRYFYDSPASGKVVHAVDAANSRVFLKKSGFVTGRPIQITDNLLTRIVVNKVRTVPGNSRFLITGTDPNSGDPILIGGLRQIPFEDFSLFSTTGRNIYISPEEKELFRFSATKDDTGVYALPMLELTDENKLRLGYITATVDADLVLSSFGNRVIISGREGYIMYNKDNPDLATFELAGSTNINENNFRISLYGADGDVDIYSTGENGTITFRNPIVLKPKTLDITGAPGSGGALIPAPQPDPVAENPLPIKPFKDVVFPTIPDEIQYDFVKRQTFTKKRFSYY